MTEDKTKEREVIIHDEDLFIETYKKFKLRCINKGIRNYDEQIKLFGAYVKLLG